MQCPLASSTSKPLSRSACRGPVSGIQSLIRASEGGQQEPKLRKREPGKGQELPTVTLKFCIRYHAAIVDLISDKVCCGDPSADAVFQVADLGAVLADLGIVARGLGGQRPSAATGRVQQAPGFGDRLEIMFLGVALAPDRLPCPLGLEP